MKQALEMSEQNFVTKFNHAQYLVWSLYYMANAQRVTLSPVPGGGPYRSKSEWMFTIEYYHVGHQVGTTKE